MDYQSAENWWSCNEIIIIIMTIIIIVLLNFIILITCIIILRVIIIILIIASNTFRFSHSFEWNSFLLFTVRFLFWTDVGDHPKIMRSSLGGRQVTVVREFVDQTVATALAVDFTENRYFQGNARVIFNNDQALARRLFLHISRTFRIETYKTLIHFSIILNLLFLI